MTLFTNDELLVLRTVKRYIDDKRAFTLVMEVDSDGDLSFEVITAEDLKPQIKDTE